MKRVASYNIGKLVFLACLLVSSYASAANIQVTSDQDPVTLSQGTLRYSIQNAANGDTISFASDVTHIALTQGEIAINANLTIQGSGVTLNGNNVSRILRINEKLKVYLEGLTFTNGNPNQGGGGAVLNQGSQLIAKNCLFTNNRSVSGEAMGGAIYNLWGKVILENCFLLENQAGSSGGAIFTFAGAMLIKHSILEGNKSRFGGAIENRGENNLQIENTSFKSNVSEKEEGGAIANNMATLIVSDSDFEANVAAQSGGAIWNNNRSNLTVINSLFTGNSAGNNAHGGAIYNSIDGQLSTKNCIFRVNTPDDVYKAKS